MSGPIIRKYGFPNHEQIFGSRPLEHGADAEPAADVKPADKPAEAKAEPKPKAAPKKKK
ncbi:hypothetical protein [Paludisphaera borealis]|uniref:Uncharacterized protein n=1 Tax=Paludisphaera borealis TaxID=1387353 RepID=A0A1U7CJZ3_9BACT|nr:hypothetical protein [Paludisphaera borealis]APW59260.1 hypothetical protein BSF38_00676 [Paludisphaera borealis]MDR3619154.1 hypothetical protein [Paludisphaera borealis]